MTLLTTSETVVWCLSFTPRFPRLGRIWMLGIRIWPVLEVILLIATTCWRVVVIEIGSPKLLTYSWILGSRWGFESTWFWYFCFSFSVLLCLLVVFSYNHPNCSQVSLFLILLQLPSALLLNMQFQVICFSFSFWR